MFTIGTIVKPQGLRGEVRVYPTTDDPSRFSLLREVFLRHEKDTSPRATQKYAITAARVQKGMVVLSLEGVDDRTAAEALTGAVLLIPDEWALPLDKDEYYVRDLIGCTAIDENGTPLGEVTEVFPTGANDVYVIRPPAGSVPGDAFMVPAVKDVVRAVDMENKRITLRLTEGLRELRTGTRFSKGYTT